MWGVGRTGCHRNPWGTYIGELPRSDVELVVCARALPRASESRSAWRGGIYGRGNFRRPCSGEGNSSSDGARVAQHVAGIGLTKLAFGWESVPHAKSPSRSLNLIDRSAFIRVCRLICFMLRAPCVCVSMSTLLIFSYGRCLHAFGPRGDVSTM